MTDERMPRFGKFEFKAYHPDGASWKSLVVGLVGALTEIAKAVYDLADAVRDDE